MDRSIYFCFKFCKKTNSILDQQPSDNPNDYSYIENAHENLSYSLFSFKTQPETNVIIRFSIDGYVNTETSSLNASYTFQLFKYYFKFKLL